MRSRYRSLALGMLIQQLRSEQGISQYTLGFDTGTSQSTISRIESGTEAGDLELIARIERVLGREPGALPSTADRVVELADGVSRAVGAGRLETCTQVEGLLIFCVVVVVNGVEIPLIDRLEEECPVSCSPPA